MTEPIKCFWMEPTDEEGVFARADTGERMFLRDAPAGAMWIATWFESQRCIVDGELVTLVVKLPDGRDWMPGAESANCTRKGEDHDCWCVHGTPPELTVDKNPEPGRSTCQAGGGSIGAPQGMVGGWHGFLKNGYLVEA